jgi:hypothetical protein
MKDGKVLEKHIKHAVGSLEVPMDDQMLQQKFTDQCVAVLGDGLKLASDALWNIENVDDVADITKVL